MVGITANSVMSPPLGDGGGCIEGSTTNGREQPPSASAIADFYSGKTIFITGGTGFMGKVLVEKLLRSCPNIDKIYLLIRSKKGLHAQDRLNQLLSSPLFNQIRKERDLSKIVAIEGDITQPNLDISASDTELLQRTVNIVFHSAATVKFDEKLKLSVTINLLGTQRLVELCKKVRNLQALVHVSTAYCNCDRQNVREEVYAPPHDPDHLVAEVAQVDESALDRMTPQLIGSLPNTYTFTKALAESWLKKNRDGLPLVIVRPSIVLCSFGEPLKGWVDNWNGPTGIIAAAGKGIFRTMRCGPRKIADLIPVDMVISLMVASAWRVANTPRTAHIPIYNCCTGMRNPISWKRFIDLCFVYMRRHPFSEICWYPGGSVTASPLRNALQRLLLQYVPAYLSDSVCWILGKKQLMVPIQRKLVKAASCLEYFTNQEWKFEDRNVRALNQCLSEYDRRQFCFDVSHINWEEYIENYVLGIRRFIFKEDESTLPSARRNMRALLWQHRIMQLVLVMSLWQFLAPRNATLCVLWSRALRFLLQLAKMLACLYNN